MVYQILNGAAASLDGDGEGARGRLTRLFEAHGAPFETHARRAGGISPSLALRTSLWAEWSVCLRSVWGSHAARAALAGHGHWGGTRCRGTRGFGPTQHLPSVPALAPRARCLQTPPRTCLAHGSVRRLTCRAAGASNLRGTS
ncbi:hypothetical protein B566_EDAN004863 [Ephemera danica]|nr:hypothetical protein B566_EDAN004863 [Ephemera danica]